MTDTITTLQQRIAEVDAAMHRLALGEQEVSVSDGTNSASYTQTSVGKLRAYRAELQARLALLGGSGGRRRRAIGVRF